LLRFELAIRGKNAVKFTRAIARLPGANFSAALSSAPAGNSHRPELALALRQHAAYCAALESAGVEVAVLGADAAHPDAPFVEDTAIVTQRGAIIAHPGAASRVGEVDSIEAALGAELRVRARIEAPGTLDGGDVCEADGHYFIGISQRSNESGAQQLASHLAAWGYSSSLIDIRAVPALLHLKSGRAYLGERRLVVAEPLAAHPAFDGYEVIAVKPDEAYAANCIRVNDIVLIAAGYPIFQATLAAMGYRTVALDMSEFRKVDGGLSCLSLRW
jgi:dimethylargininase